ncbi:MAG: DNA repair exonuclease [Veillonella sp.]|nr:DNA repair exonuclease [Veillonella sp.]
MQPFRFIHCGDLHLGAPFQYATGISSAVDRAVSEATYVALDKIIDTVITEHVHAVVIAGDIYNSEDHNLEAQVRFVRSMYRLAEHRIDVYMVQGNHDPAESWKAQLQMPDNVHIFSSEQVQRFPLIVNNIEIGGVYGISCGHGNESDNYARQYRAFERDEFSLAVMHGTVGSSVGSENHNVTGPCNLTDLTEAAMDYWALGHIHKSQVLSEEPLVVYAGNSQGLHRIKIDIAGMQNETDFLEILRRKKENLRKQHKKNILLSIVLSGTGPLHRLCTQEGIRKLWLQESQNEEKGKSIFVMPYRITSNTRPSINLVERRLLTDVVGDYLRAYDDMVDGDAIQTARQIMADRPEFKRLGAYADLLSDELLARALKRCEIEGVTVLMGANDEH